MISILINTYNRKDILIENLLNLKPIWNKAEIIVLDDCSSDGTDKSTKEFISRHKINIRYLRNEKNQGYAKSLNIGIKACSKDFIFIVNDDNILMQPRDSLDIFEKHQKKNYIIGTKLKMNKLPIIKRIKGLIYRIPAETLAGEVYNYNGSKVRTVKYCNNVFGFNRNTGILFDEKSYIKNVFRIESDFQKRARKKGIKILYYPDIVTIHKHIQYGGLREKKINFLLYCIYNHIIFLRKNFPISKYYKLPFYFILKTSTHPFFLVKIIKVFDSSFRNKI